MSMNQPHTPDGPVTIAELLLALASFPQDATVHPAADESDAEVFIEVEIDGVAYTLLQSGERAHHYEPPVVEETTPTTEPKRSHPGDDYAAAQDVLDWLRQRGIGLVNPGQGHNETASPVPEAQRAQLARDFAARNRGGAS